MSIRLCNPIPPHPKLGFLSQGSTRESKCQYAIPKEMIAGLAGPSEIIYVETGTQEELKMLSTGSFFFLLKGKLSIGFKAFQLTTSSPF